MGLSYQEFVEPAARLSAEILFGMILERGYLRSVARLRPPNGDAILCEYYAAIEGDEMVVRLRPIGGAGGAW